MLAFDRSDSPTYAGTISGSGGVTMLGSGTTVLSGSNTYNGTTRIAAGILKAGITSAPNVSGAFGNNSAVVLANVAGAGLDISGYNTQIGSLAGGGASGGNVTLGAATLSVGGDNSSTTYAGAISSSGSPGTSLIKIGAGRLTLSGSNTYTGGTLVSAGVLAAGAGSALSADSSLIIDGGTLDASGFANTVSSLTISSGGLRLGLGNTLTSSGAAVLAGNLNLSGTGVLGIQPMLTYSSFSGSFATVTGLDPNYALVYNATELDAAHKAQIGGNLSVTPVYPAVITGGATNLTVNVANSAPPQSATLTFTAAASGTGYGLSTTGSLAPASSGIYTIADGFNSGSLPAGSYSGTVTVTGSSSLLGGPAVNSGASQPVTVNVLGHSNPLLTVAGGNNQSVFVGTGGVTAVLSLTDSGTNLSPLDVNTLSSGLSGTTGTAVIASGGSGAYTAALATGTVGLSQTQTFSLKAGDEQALPGASAVEQLVADRQRERLQPCGGRVHRRDADGSHGHRRLFQPCQQQYLDGVQHGGRACRRRSRPRAARVSAT